MTNLTKVHLHIGTHKTGTTAFQKFCSRHEAMLEEQGFLYPKSGRPNSEQVSEGHHLLPWALTRHVTQEPFWSHLKGDFSDVWEALSQEIRNRNLPNVIISSEEFDTLSAEQALFVAQQLQSFDVSVLVYFRRLDEFVESMYTTDVVHNFETKTIDEYILAMRTPLLYSSILNIWNSAFPNRVKVSFYNSERSSRTAIVSELAEHIGINLSSASQAEVAHRTNVSGFTWYVVELCRRMRACGSSQYSIIQFSKLMSRVLLKDEPIGILKPSARSELIQLGAVEIEKLVDAQLAVRPTDHFFVSPANITDEEWEFLRMDDSAPLNWVTHRIAETLDKLPTS